MSDYDENQIKNLFNEILDLFQLDVDVWTRKRCRSLALVERQSKMSISCYGRAGNHQQMLSGVKYFSFDSEEDFLMKLGKIEEFGSFPKKIKNPFFGCNSIEEVNVKLDLMLNRDEHEI